MDLREPAVHSAVTSVKHFARILHGRARNADPSALRTLRLLREFREATEDQIVEKIQRRHCLTATALRLGFQSWEHALAVLHTHDQDIDDFGTLLYPSSCSGHWNIWSAHYDEASEIRASHGGYLLAYRRQFLIVEREYIDSLALDPDDPDWAAIGRDWVRPRNRTARARLYEKLVQNALVLEALGQS